MLNDSPFDVYQTQWWQELYQQAPIAIGIYVGQGHIIEFANPLMLELWGRKEEELVGKPLFQALPEVANQGFEEILADVLKTGIPFKGTEMPATLERNKQIELCYFDILYKPFKDSNGVIRGIIQVANEVTEQVKARQRAEKSEEMLKLALQSSRMGTWHIDLTNNTFTRSDNYDKVFGYDEPLPSFDLEIFLQHVIPDDRPLALEQHQLGLSHGAINYEVRIQWPDKSVHWLQVKGETSYTLNKKPLGMSGIIMDVTEQKLTTLRERQLAVERAAREVAEQQRKVLNELFMEAPALIATVKGPSFVYDLVNPQYQQQLFPGRDLKGKPLLKAVPELKDQPIIDILKKVYETGESFSGQEMPVKIKKSATAPEETCYFNLAFQAIKDAEGQIVGVLFFGYEVSEQIFARQRIQSNETNLRIALEAGKMGTWHLDLINDTAFRSHEHDEIFGYRQLLPQWSKKQFLSHVVAEEKEQVEAHFNMAFKYGDLSFETRILTADQQNRWIAVRGKTFYENNKPIRMAGVITDITERKLVEEKLKELTQELALSNAELKHANTEVQAHLLELSQKNNQLQLINADLDNFIYTASHDLKTPISNIEGLIKLLLRNIPESTLEQENISKTFNLIDASIQRFKHTIIELTDIAKLQKDGEEITMVSIPSVVQEVELDLQMLILETGAQLDKKFFINRPIPFSHKNLKSIVYNLLSNAIKYHSPARTPQITVSCYQEEGHPVLKIKDNGLGIKEKDLNKIFSMYTRLHNHVEGTGVGLYLVKRIVDSVNGQLLVESEEGIGSTFTIIFPQEITAK